MTTRLLVYHTGGLGDFITILPLLSTRKQAGSVKITLLGKVDYGTLGKANGLVDEIIDVNSGLNNFLYVYLPENDRINKFFSQFDELILFTASNSPLYKNALTNFIGLLYRQSTLPDNVMPIIDYRLRLINENESGPSTPYPDLSKAISAHAVIPSFFVGNFPTVAIHPGSGSKQKNWPFNCFIEVATQLRNAGFSIVWFTGPAEPAYPLPASDRHFKEIPLIEAAVILSQCTVYIGNDSGFSHLAAASGCPSVVLFGASDPAVWAPKGKRKATILYHPKTCSPCHLKSPISCNNECFNAISVDEVVNSTISMHKSD